MRTQRKAAQTDKSVGKGGDLGVDCFSFACDWSREWREFSGPITAIKDYFLLSIENSL